MGKGKRTQRGEGEGDGEGKSPPGCLLGLRPTHAALRGGSRRRGGGREPEPPRRSAAPQRPVLSDRGRGKPGSGRWKPPAGAGSAKWVGGGVCGEGEGGRGESGTRRAPGVCCGAWLSLRFGCRRESCARGRRFGTARPRWLRAPGRPPRAAIVRFAKQRLLRAGGPRPLQGMRGGGEGGEDGTPLPCAPNSSSPAPKSLAGAGTE